MPSISFQILRAVRTVQDGGILAYPTEALWGFGCDPANETAVQRLLELKQRSWKKGLILIASEWSQIAPWVALPEQPPATLDLWPGHVTCLLPAAPTVSPLVRGTHPTIAVRISAHEPVRQLCQAFGGALISTSANRNGRPTPGNLTRLRAQFGANVDFYLNAPLGGKSTASRIMDPFTGRTIR